MTSDNQTAEDLGTIELDQFLPHPPAKVWRALTQPELVARWQMPGDFRLEVGHRYTMQGTAIPATGFSGTIRAEVLAFEEEKLLEVGWRDANPPGERAANWTITWTLRPEGTGTRLFLVQSGIDPDDPLQQRSRQIMSDGWRSRVLVKLEHVLDSLDQEGAS